MNYSFLIFLSHCHRSASSPLLCSTISSNGGGALTGKHPPTEFSKAMNVQAPMGANSVLYGNTVPHKEDVCIKKSLSNKLFTNLLSSKATVLARSWRGQIPLTFTSVMPIGRLVPGTAIGYQQTNKKNHQFMMNKQKKQKNNNNKQNS